MSNDAWHMVRAGRYERRAGGNTFTAIKLRSGRWRLSCYGRWHYTLRVDSLRAAMEMVAKEVQA